MEFESEIFWGDILNNDKLEVPLQIRSLIEHILVLPTGHTLTQGLFYFFTIQSPF